MHISKRILIICCLAVFWVSGQERKSKGDDYFFSYAYQDAIRAYEEDLAKGIGLSPKQNRNLADAYFKTENFTAATDIYLQLFAKDSLSGNFHVNRLLQGLQKTADNERAKAILMDEKLNFANEIMENADFNAALLDSDEANLGMDVNIFNLSANSPQADFSPAFYGSELLFTSGRPTGKRQNYIPSGEAYLDIFEGGISNGGQVANAVPSTTVQSSEFHKATPYFSEALNSVFYVLSNTVDGELEFDENGKNALGIGMQKLGGDFRMLWKDLGISFYYPFYDEATGKLFFAANFEDGYGGTDIYYVYTNNGQVMSAPINLGPRVNSPGNEIAPYIFEGTLYFSSDIFYGLGGMDIYKTNLNDGENFSIPVNLGDAINSSQDDFGFVIRNEGDGLLGYFSSNRPGGQGGDDIYGFLVDEKPGLRTLVLSGQVVKGDGTVGVPEAAVRLLTTEGALLKEVYADLEGNYRIEIPWQEEVLLEATAERCSNFSQVYGAQALEQLQKGPANLGITAYEDIVEEKENQKVIKLKKFYFGKGKSTVTADIAKELDKVVEAVKSFPQMQLRVETHTDSRGGSVTNFRVSQARSDAIKQYLIKNGVPKANILYAVGYGEDKIINNCTNGVFCLEMLHQQNQRSLIVVLNDNIIFE